MRLVNRPRSITSQLPRRDEKTLRSRGFSPRSVNQRPASPDAGIAPAGEMWSVVMSSPKTNSGRAA